MFTRLRFREFVLGISLLLLFPMSAHPFGYTHVKVVDFFTGRPIEGARVTLNNGSPLNHGSFLTGQETIIPTPKARSTIKVKAHGYMRTEEVIPAPLVPNPYTIKLMPFRPKALYLSFYGIGAKSLRDPALKLIQETEVNSLVIDIKGDRGWIPYPSSIPLASQVGAQRIITVKDMKSLIQSLKEKGIYTIARIVVFKDNPLALARPDLALKDGGGEIWRDRENLAWVDPFKKEVWDYNIQIAIEAAQQGFDEIQFDYVRFPDSSSGPRFSMANTEENRVKAISGFLQEAHDRLLPYNVFLAADIFGYICWNLNDTNIGQKLEALAPAVDYLSPMLYPSGYHKGIPGYPNPMANPYEIVYLSLKKAQERTNLPPIRFRPWLQAFRDYAFDRRFFNGREIRGQIAAAEKFGSQGWMLWNPSNNYSSEALSTRKTPSTITSLAPYPKTL